MNRTGPAPTPRGFQAFGQPNPAARNLPLGSGRLQNTNKLGNGATWGLGAVNGAPGLPNTQGRAPGGASNATFAQSIAGSQPATPLDLSEFPSLSGAPQTQYQNPGQAVWGNSNQRATQHTPVQRPQQQHPISQQSTSQQQNQQPSQTQEQSQQSREQLYSGSQMTGSNDDYHRGGQGGIGQLGASGQPQSTSIDEFPPLRRNGTDDDQQDRRGSLMQNAAFGGYPGANTFSMPSAQDPARHRLPSSQTGRPDSRASTLVDRIMSPSSLSFASASNRQVPTSATTLDGSIPPTPRGNQQSNINSLLDSFVNQQQQIGSSSRNTQSQQPPSRQQRGSLASGGAAQTAESVPFDEMTPIDKYGLAGLLANVRSPDADTAALAIGQDLTQLGMDLNSPEPLHHTFSGPFGPPTAHPYQPTYTLPDCYTVDNAPPPRHKLPGFADETLIWIFYFQPRDIMQEFAASELTNRNWRYHKEMRMWLTKDTAMGEPVPMAGGDGERGSYIVFNPRSWQRSRVEMDLRYEDLDTRIQVGEGRIVPGGGVGVEGSRMP
ncbi:MAG: hypothetical protein LQ339_008036 [Xanthoria mediterranea]|nr:MAG: hypothetical protein LQ339_008036 [Xanthoria mediterranea]